MGGKGKGKGKFNKESKFQVELEGEFKDYRADEDAALKRAFLVGQPNARYQIRDNDYEYHFADKMIQINKKTGKQRKIRPPWKMFPPKEPLLPAGPMVVIAVPPGGSGSIDIEDPNNPGKRITVALPPGAKPGAKIAVPIPGKGESVADVVDKQKKHGSQWSTGAKIAAGAAGVGALAVGGIVLGEHLSGGAISSWADAELMPGVEAAGEWATGAAEAVGDWAGGAAETIGEAAGDAGDWAGEAAGDVGDWAGDAAEDIGDWLGDAGGDVGDFIMDLF